MKHCVFVTLPFIFTRGVGTIPESAMLHGHVSTVAQNMTDQTLAL